MWPRAASIGSQAADSTSHVRKTRTPTATALRNRRRPGAGRRSRPTGRPSRIVTPAIKPSSSVCDRLMSLLVTGRELGCPNLEVVARSEQLEDNAVEDPLESASLLAHYCPEAFGWLPTARLHVYRS